MAVDKEKLQSKTETMLRAVLVSSPREVILSRLDREYASITGEKIPFRPLGFNSLEDYIRSIPHVARLETNREGDKVLRGVATTEDSHIAKLVRGQKKPKKRKSTRPNYKPTSRRPVNYTPGPVFSNPSRFGPNQRQNTTLPPRFQRKLNNTHPQIPPSNTQHQHNSHPSLSVRVSSYNQGRMVTATDNLSHRQTSQHSDGKSKKTPRDNVKDYQDRTKPEPEKEPTTTPVVNAPKAEINEATFGRIKQVLARRVNGLWSTRLGPEYLQMFGEQLPEKIIEVLTGRTDLCRVERPIVGRILLYPVEEKKVEQQPVKAQPKPEVKPVVEEKQKENKPTLRTEMEVYLSHADSINNFYVQKKGCEKTLDQLMERLQEYGEVAEPLPKTDQIVYCLAKFTEDDTWYRAKILQQKDNESTVDIMYLDYGNKETISRSRLRAISKEMLILSVPLAILCSLEQLEPLTENATERLRALAGENVLKMTIKDKEDGVTHVRLLNTETNTDINQQLLNEGCACIPSNPNTSPPILSPRSPGTPTSKYSVDTAAAVSVPAKKPVIRRLSSRSRSPGIVEIPEERYLDVVISTINSTDNIKLRLYGPEYSEKLDALEASMLYYYKDSCQDHNITSVEVGEHYALLSEEAWYRVKVLKKEEEEKVEVYFVDYGDSCSASMSELRSLPSRFLQVPFQAFTVSLHGIPKTKNPEVIEKLDSLVRGKVCIADVIRRNQEVISVELYDTTSEDVDIYITQIIKSLVIPDEELIPMLPKKGETVDIFVTHITDDGLLSVQIAGAGTKRLEELMEDAAEHYSKKSKAADFISHPEVGIVCCAYSAQNNNWYRAKITRLFKEERKVEVKFVDYGNYEIIPELMLRKPASAVEHVTSLPFQIVECRLDGISKDMWTPAFKENVLELTSGYLLLLEATSESGEVPLVKLFLVSDEFDGPLPLLDALIEPEPEREEPVREEAAPVEPKNEEILNLITPPSSEEDTTIIPTSVEQEPKDSTIEIKETTTKEIKEITTKEIKGTTQESFGLPALKLPDNFVDVVVTEAPSPTCFFFQRLKFQRLLLLMSQCLCRHYKNEGTVKPVKMVKVEGVYGYQVPEDGKWYRVIVESFLPSSQVCVRLVDYGHWKIAAKRDLVELPDQVLESPHLAIKACLADIELLDDADKQGKAEERFQELVQDRRLVVQNTHSVTSCRVNDTLPVLLFDTSEPAMDICFSDVLVREGLAHRTEALKSS